MAQLIPLSAAFMPFLIWPVELVFPYPHIIEETAKAALLIPILGNSNRTYKVKMAILIGVLFAVSESVLYLFNIYLVGDINTLFTRFAYTIPLHVITTLTILLPTMLDRRLIILGLAAAIVIHYFFNAALR